MPRGSDQNPAHHAVQNRLHVVDRIGVPLDDGGEADGADHLDQDEYGLEKLVLGAALGEAAGFQRAGDLVPKQIFAQAELPLDRGPGKVPLEQPQRQLVPLEILDHVVDEQHDVLGEIPGAPGLHVFVSLGKHPGRDLVGELLQKMFLVVKIQVKRALRHIGAPHDFIDGGFSHALFQEQRVGCVDQVLLFLLLLALHCGGPLSCVCCLYI